jgi:hypothetical protein
MVINGPVVASPRGAILHCTAYLNIITFFEKKIITTVPYMLLYIASLHMDIYHIFVCPVILILAI